MRAADRPASVSQSPGDPVIIEYRYGSVVYGSDNFVINNAAVELVCSGTDSGNDICTSSGSPVTIDLHTTAVTFSWPSDNAFSGDAGFNGFWLVFIPGAMDPLDADQFGLESSIANSGPLSRSRVDVLPYEVHVGFESLAFDAGDFVRVTFRPLFVDGFESGTSAWSLTESP